MNDLEKVDSSLAVVICTRNPLISRFVKVLDGLKRQSLDQEDWNLIIVDNGSDPDLASQLALSDFLSNGRIVVERKAGLTYARLRGIKESKGHLVFVDDDNVLAPDYLKQVKVHFETKPWIGAFGGNVRLSFESEVPSWVTPLRPMLAERVVTRDCWSCSFSGNTAIPCGAGMAVRREVADAYAERLEVDEGRLGLDRKGDSLISDGDTDLALTAVDIGLATGQLADLSLDHLIPEGRLNRDYLCRLGYGMAYSGVMVRTVREETRKGLHPPTWLEKFRDYWQWLKAEKNHCAVMKSWAKGYRDGLRDAGVL